MMIGKSYVRFTSEFLQCNVKTPTLIQFWYWTVHTMSVQLCMYIVRRLCTYIVRTNPYVQKTFIPNVIRTKSVCTGLYVQCTYIVRTFACWVVDRPGMLQPLSLSPLHEILKNFCCFNPYLRQIGETLSFPGGMKVCYLSTTHLIWQVFLAELLFNINDVFPSDQKSRIISIQQKITVNS